VAGLDRAGHRVALLAPQAAGSALIGPGPGEARHLLPWEAAQTAELFTDPGASASLRHGLGAFDAAIAYTRSADLARGLGAAIPRVLVHDPMPPPGAGHVAEWLARPAASLGVSCAEAPPTLRATSEEHEQAAAIIGELPSSFLAVHPGSGSPGKTWPAARFASLLDALGAERFLLVEGPADAEVAAALRARGGAVAARGLPARVLGAALARAAAYVGNDSGVTHLAAAWGAPTVALYGPTDPGVWSPVGPRVAIVRSSGPSMEGIAVETVAAAVAPFLAEGRPR
jgi:Glycosyltransferase family 9 (heptosyltransferase)